MYFCEITQNTSNGNKKENISTLIPGMYSFLPEKVNL